MRLEQFSEILFLQESEFRRRLCSSYLLNRLSMNEEKIENSRSFYTEGSKALEIVQTYYDNKEVFCSLL